MKEVVEQIESALEMWKEICSDNVKDGTLSEIAESDCAEAAEAAEALQLSIKYRNLHTEVLSDNQLYLTVAGEAYIITVSKA